MNDNAQKILNQIRKTTDKTAEIAMILGSGWGKVVEYMEEKTLIPYSTLEGMPACTVKGHKGNFAIGKLFGKKVVVMQGRFHLYEGKTVEEVVLPIEVMRLLEAKTLVLTNSAGGLSDEMCVGDIMIIEDHINLTMRSPLTGIIPTDEYPVFVDMTRAYDKELSDKLYDICISNSISAKKGVYMQLLGGNYETPAEIRAFIAMGADAVGMSTVMECIYARYRKMKVVGMSCITNKGAGLSNEILNHKEVLEITEKNENNFKIILDNFLSQL